MQEACPAAGSRWRPLQRPIDLLAVALALTSAAGSYGLIGVALDRDAASAVPEGRWLRFLVNGYEACAQQSPATNLAPWIITGVAVALARAGGRAVFACSTAGVVLAALATGGFLVAASKTPGVGELTYIYFLSTVDTQARVLAGAWIHFVGALTMNALVQTLWPVREANTSRQ